MGTSGRREEDAECNDQKQEETKTQFRITSTPTTKLNYGIWKSKAKLEVQRKREKCGTLWNSVVEDNL